MTRAELIQRLAERFPQLPSRDADIVVKEILVALAQTLVNGDRIEIRGFGSFQLNYRQPRRGRNPATGAAVVVPGKYVPHFRPGKELREQVAGQADTNIPLKKAA